MMHKNGLIATIKDENGKVLRETRDHAAVTVYIPFYTHYSIYLKNTHNCRAVATIEIDGTDVMNGKGIIVPANGNITVDRFCIDGNLKSGSKFYFVPQDDGRVADPTSEDNGMVKITFKLEKVKPFYIIEQNYTATFPNQYDYGHPKPIMPNQPPRFWNNNFNNTVDNRRIDASSDPKFYSPIHTPSNWSTGSSLNVSASAQPERGATVEGNQSNQQFIHGYVNELESTETVISFEIRPSKEALTVDKVQTKPSDNKVNKIKKLLDENPEMADKIEKILEALK